MISMKKIYILICLLLILLTSSCYRDTDIDDILNKNVVENQLLLYDTGGGFPELNKKFIFHFNFSELLFSDESGIYMTEDSFHVIYKYIYETKEIIEYSRCPYNIVMSTYDNNLIAHDDNDKYYVISFETFEIIEEISKDIRKYALGVSNYEHLDGGGIEYSYKGQDIRITIDDVINNCNLEINWNRNKLEYLTMYRYKDEFYVSFTYKYSFLSREQVVFKKEDDGYRFIDYCHFSVDSVEYIKYCGPVISDDANNE